MGDVTVAPLLSSFLANDPVVELDTEYREGVSRLRLLPLLRSTISISAGEVREYGVA